MRVLSRTVAGVVLIAGCRPLSYVPTLQEVDPGLEEAARAIDDLTWFVDAYGGASMSTPMLVQPDDSFKFNLSTTADGYFASEKNEISGREAGSIASASVVGASVSASVDLAAMQQYAVALEQYRQNQTVIAEKQRILNAAAVQQYNAAVQSAQQLTDAQQRAAAISAAAGQLAQSLSGPAADATNAPPSPPASPALPVPAAVPNAAASLIPAIAGPQALFAQGTPTVSGDTRSALLLGAGDTATAAMLGLLGDPTKMTKFKGKRVIFGVAMVAATPGWKTRTGYSADLEVRVEYRWAFARPEVRDAFLAQRPDLPVEQAAIAELQRCVVDSLTTPLPDYDLPGDRAAAVAQRLANGLISSGATAARFGAVRFDPYVYRPNRPLEEIQPIVAAVSPMGDAQSLDLQASSREIQQRAFQIAAALAGTGYGASANAFLAFAKQSQTDLETRTSNVIVSAYASTGGQFGFKMQPRLTASPSSGRGQHVLNVPTFPTLLIVGADDNELRSRILVVGDHCFVVERQLVFTTNTKWTRIDEPCMTYGYPDQERCKRKEFTEQERVELIHRARELVVRLLSGAPRDLDLGHLRSRLEFLGAILNGSQQAMWLPVELIAPAPSAPKPAITASAPNKLELVLDEHGNVKPLAVQMVLAGDELDQIDTAKIIAPGGLGVAAKLQGKALQLSFTISKPGIYTFGLPIKNSSGAIVTPALEVAAPANLFTIHAVTDSSNKDKEDSTLTFSPGAPAEVLKSQIERKREFANGVKVEVKSSPAPANGGTR